MKKYNKFVAILAALVLCLSPLFTTSLTANAEEPVTYYLKYITEKNEWRYQTGSSFNDGAPTYDIPTLQASIKDGDLLVIDGTAAPINLTVDVHLNNLTIVQSTYAVITAKSIENFYAINDSVCAINGDIKNAYVYDGCVCNFNSNVDYLELASEKNIYLFATVAVVGTVNHVQANGKDVLHFECYNFEANSMLIEKGVLKTPEAKYSKTPQAAPVAPAPVTPAAPSVSPSDEWDDVPKTADPVVLPICLMGIALLCVVGSRKIKNV